MAEMLILLIKHLQGHREKLQCVERVSKGECWKSQFNPCWWSGEVYWGEESAGRKRKTQRENQNARWGCSCCWRRNWKLIQTWWRIRACLVVIWRRTWTKLKKPLTIHLMFKIAIHLKKVKIAIHELQGLEDKRGKYEEQVAGASISSRVNSYQSKCFAEYEQTGSFAGKLS